MRRPLPSVVFSRRGKEAAPALRACAVCPVSRECEAAVAPAESWFDGVCAGRLWRNGRPVKPRRREGRTAADELAAALDAAGAALAPPVPPAARASAVTPAPSAGPVAPAVPASPAVPVAPAVPAQALVLAGSTRG
ncbi:hypothetical protein RGF97_12660 [Streptomyces roseicoloratus]|uniref:4Fe-4S Wbl-type domain-containing protein n=1 Tax=Streptomyces roseicoloratus TaxID=2508722 RepID=A0ABY9RTN5_9ACTN|nr:hypothetical protein [Streptomyces roseicoloratus]WMX45536.1 hypothetical protein RGF97_12660 [Streptomyces roseicoloratus]